MAAEFKIGSRRMREISTMKVIWLDNGAVFGGGGRLCFGWKLRWSLRIITSYCCVWG